MKISQNFPNLCVFRPNARKISAWFVKYFEKYAKIMHFCYLLRMFWKISKILRLPGGASPPDPLRGRPPKMFTSEPKSWWRRWELIVFHKLITIFPLENLNSRNFYLMYWIILQSHQNLVLQHTTSDNFLNFYLSTASL